jgi:transposase
MEMQQSAGAKRMCDEELTQRFQKGETYREIAAAAGQHQMTIMARVRKLREQGRLAYRREPLSKDHPKRKLAAAKDMLVTKLHEQGLSVDEIAQRVKLSPAYIKSKIGNATNYDAELQLIKMQLAS